MAKNILIVGGNSGVGLETLRLLSGEGHHLTVALRHPEEISLEGLSAQHFDANDPEVDLDLPDALDGLVYFPGTIPLRPFARLSDQDFIDDWTVNFLGAVRVIRQALPSLKKSGEASVVLFSTVAVQTGLPFHASIAAAKGAVEGLIRSLAAELAPAIRVNGIAPSLTDTPLAASLLASPEKVEASKQRHPLKRIGDPAETARTVAFLLGKDSGFMTGHVLSLDGGYGNVRGL